MYHFGYKRKYCYTPALNPRLGLNVSSKLKSSIVLVNSKLISSLPDGLCMRWPFLWPWKAPLRGPVHNREFFSDITHQSETWDVEMQIYIEFAEVSSIFLSVIYTLILFMQWPVQMSVKVMAILVLIIPGPLKQLQTYKKISRLWFFTSLDWHRCIILFWNLWFSSLLLSLSFMFTKQLYVSFLFDYKIDATQRIVNQVCSRIISYFCLDIESICMHAFWNSLAIWV